MRKHLIYKAELFFVRALLPFASGILITNNFGQACWMAFLWKICTLLFFTLAAGNIFYRRFNFYKFKGIIGLLSALFLLFAGSLCYLLNKHDFKESYFTKGATPLLKVRINDEPQTKNGLVRFKAEVLKTYKTRRHGSEPASGNLLLSLREKDCLYKDLEYGDELLVNATYKKIDTPANPGEFDYAAWLSSQNIYEQAYLSKGTYIRTAKNKGSTIKQYALRLRRRQVNFYRKIIKSHDAFAVASTLILGYKSNLSMETLEIYSKTGTIHALSVSGMHVGIVYLVMEWLLALLNKRRYARFIKMIVTVLLIWGYALITGFSPSILRSVIMLSVFIIAKGLSKNNNTYNVLAFSAFCLLLYNPFYILDVGFQLSYLAVIGLIYLQPKLQHLFYFRLKVLNQVWGVVAVSLAAQIATFPLSIYYFHQFPLYFLFSNLFITLPMALLMYLGLAILILKLEMLAPFFEWLISFTNSGLDYISQMPFSSLSGLWINKTELILLSIAIILLCIAFAQRRKQYLFGALILILSFQSLLSADQYIAHRQDKVLLFNLKKHRASSYIRGKKAFIKTDLQPADKRFKYHIQPALDKNKVTSIKILTQH